MLVIMIGIFVFFINKWFRFFNNVLLLVNIILCVEIFEVSFGGDCLSVIIIVFIIFINGFCNVLRILCEFSVNECGIFLVRLWLCILILIGLFVLNVELIWCLMFLVVVLLIKLLKLWCI